MACNIHVTQYCKSIFKKGTNVRGPKYICISTLTQDYKFAMVTTISNKSDFTAYIYIRNAAANCYLY